MIVKGKRGPFKKTPRETITAEMIVTGKRGPMVVREACGH